MNGITVLNEYSMLNYSIIGIIFHGILTLMFLIIAIMAFTDNEVFVGILCSTMLLIFASLMFIRITTNRVVYYEDVTIDENVPFVEFYDKYIINGKDGDIYHLQLREAKEVQPDD